MAQWWVYTSAGFVGLLWGGGIGAIMGYVAGSVLLVKRRV
jgi:hypothetical protein